jgi:hypothetical protein
MFPLTYGITDRIGGEQATMRTKAEKLFSEDEEELLRILKRHQPRRSESFGFDDAWLAMDEEA